MQTEEQIGRYELLRKLGEGGMAEVWQARDRYTDRIVAVKFLANQDPESQRQLLFEYRVQAKLTHPNIIPVIDLVQEHSNSLLVMQFVEQGSLKDFMAQHPGPMPPNQALAVIEPILSALDYVHSHGLIHRDVKPSNILLGSDFKPYLTDFGVSLARSSTPFTPMGTPCYMSPEQNVSRSVSFGSDIYSAGVLLYEMLTGQVPFDAPEGDTDFIVKSMHLHEVPQPLRKFNPQISPRLEAAVLRALEKDPADRFQSAEEMRKALLESSSSSAEPSREPDPLPFWKEVSRRTWITFVDAAALTFGSMFAVAVLFVVISAARKYLL